MCACGVCGAPRMYTWYKCGTCTETGCRWSRTNASPAVTAEAAMSAGPWPKYPLPPERLPPMSQAQQRVEEPPGGDRRPSWCQSQCRSQGAAPASPCSWEERPPPGRWRGLLEAGAKGGPVSEFRGTFKTHKSVTYALLLEKPPPPPVSFPAPPGQQGWHIYTVTRSLVPVCPDSTLFTCIFGAHIYLRF